MDSLKEEGLSPCFHQLDITSAESIEKCREFIVAKYGALDVLVNNAGLDCDVSIFFIFVFFLSLVLVLYFVSSSLPSYLSS